MSKQVAVFDFDGTLADSAPIIREIYEKLAIKNRWKPIDDRTYKNLRKGTLSDARKWANIRWWQIPGVMRAGQSLFRLEANRVKLFPHMKAMIKELQDNHVPIYVLSRNSTSVIESVMDRHKVRGVVILSRASIFGKQRALKKIVSTENVSPRVVWMIGDEVRDIRSAHKAGVRSIAVSWGLQDVSILKEYRPDIIANSTHDIVKTILAEVTNA